MKTPIASFAQHHQVLAAWLEVRRRLPEPPEVIALDYHTDVLPAFGGREAVAAEGIPDAAEVAAAVSRLRHDEHYDYALRRGLVSRIALLALTPDLRTVPDPRLRVFNPPGLPDADTMLNRGETCRAFLEAVLTDWLLAPLPEPAGPFILDVDCDFFLTAAAAEFGVSGRFADWCRRAELITFSRESRWVQLLRLPGEVITGESLAAELTSAVRNLAENLPVCQMRKAAAVFEQ